MLIAANTVTTAATPASVSELRINPRYLGLNRFCSDPRPIQINTTIGNTAPNSTGTLQATAANPARQPTSCNGAIGSDRRDGSWYFARPLWARSNNASSNAKLNSTSASCAAAARSNMENHAV